MIPVCDRLLGHPEVGILHGERACRLWLTRRNKRIPKGLIGSWPIRSARECRMTAEMRGARRNVGRVPCRSGSRSRSPRLSSEVPTLSGLRTISRSDSMPDATRIGPPADAARPLQPIPRREHVRDMIDLAWLLAFAALGVGAMMFDILGRLQALLEAAFPGE